MEIILLKDVDKLGNKFDVVKVKNGFGRNYLIPQKMGIIANDTNRKRLNELVKRSDNAEAKKVDLYKSFVTKLEGAVIKIGTKAGTSGKIFGSVTNVQIIAALNEQQGVEIERRKVVLKQDIKQVGMHKATINFTKDISTEIDLEIIAE